MLSLWDGYGLPFSVKTTADIQAEEIFQVFFFFFLQMAPMLYLLPFNKGLDSAFVWVLLPVSHKGQQKNPSYTTTTQLISTKT